MAFNDKVDVTPSQFVAGNTDLHAEEKAKKLQQQKWLVLLFTFLLVFAASLGWIWSRDEVYQSQAIVHFSYAQQHNTEQSTVPVEQITLNNKRLTSNRVFSDLSARILAYESLSLTPEQLSEMLTTQANTSSRIISLFATGEDKTLLKPILENWLNLYLEQLSAETIASTEESISVEEQKLLALEDKIRDQRAVVQAYGAEHNIVSLERDENRVLAKIKSKGIALDEAESMQAEAEVELATVRQSIASGEVVFDPSDKPRMDGLYAVIAETEAELAELAENFTPTYMDMDPEIVGKKRKLAELKENYDKTVEVSQQRYLEELQRTVTSSQQKQQQLETELRELSLDAQAFNQKLEEYSRLDGALEQLQLQSQTLKDQLVQAEVQKPMQPTINILEQPFEPDFPIAPHYLRDSAIALVAAIILGLLALVLFSSIHRQQAPATSFTSYNVVPNQGMPIEHQMTARQALEEQRHSQIGHQQAPMQLGNDTPASGARLLSEKDCQGLYDAANRDGKLVISLLLCGVAPEELAAVRFEDLMTQKGALKLHGNFTRTVDLSNQCVALICAQSAEPEDTILSSRLDTSQLDQMIINIAHDAGLPYPDQFSIAALRHTYLTFLVAQGARLNDIEQVAGFVSPAELGLYRQVNRHGNVVDVESLETRYPLT